MLRWDETTGAVGVFRSPAGYTNGHTVDLEGRLVSVNATWLTRMGYAEREVLGRDIHEFMTPVSRQLAIDPIEQGRAVIGDRPAQGQHQRQRNQRRRHRQCSPFSQPPIHRG